MNLTLRIPYIAAECSLEKSTRKYEDMNVYNLKHISLGSGYG